MTILSAQSITLRNIIKPFYGRMVERGMTYGLSSAGYDVRLSMEGQIGNARCMRRQDKLSERYRIYDHDFWLASTIEHFHMPDDVLGIVHDKSSWARRGLAVQNTVIEPGWRGYLTLELTYHGPFDKEIILQHGDPIAQIVFHKLDASTVLPYEGKYQDQEAGAQPVRYEKTS